MQRTEELTIDIMGGTMLTVGQRLFIEPIRDSGVLRLRPSEEGSWEVREVVPLAQPERVSPTVGGVTLALRPIGP